MISVTFGVPVTSTVKKWQNWNLKDFSNKKKMKSIS